MWKKFIFILTNFMLYFTPAFSSLGYNATCTVSPDNCDKYKGFKCEPDLKVCRCREDFPMEYNADRETCVVKGYGSGCFDETVWEFFTCEVNQYCDNYDENRVYKGNYTCGCQRGFYPNISSENPHSTICLPAAPGLLCSDSLPCFEGLGLICNQGKCECPYPNSQDFYNFDSNPLSAGCVGVPEFPNGCNSKEQGRVNKCTKNSFCGDDNKCHCNPGFSLDGFNDHRYCRLDHNQPCDYDNRCNIQRGLKCINGVCSCGGTLAIQYDPVQNICALSEDYPCSSNREYGELPCFTGLKCEANSTDPVFQKCVKADNNDENRDVGVPGEDKNCTSGKTDDSENGNESVVLIFKMFK